MSKRHLIALVALAAVAGCGKGPDVAPRSQTVEPKATQVETQAPSEATAPATQDAAAGHTEAMPLRRSEPSSSNQYDGVQPVKAGEVLTGEDMDRLRQERAHLINRDSPLREERDQTGQK